MNHSERQPKDAAAWINRFVRIIDPHEEQGGLRDEGRVARIEHSLLGDKIVFHARGGEEGERPERWPVAWAWIERRHDSRYAAPRENERRRSRR